MRQKQVIGSRVFDNLNYLRKIAKTKSDKLRLDVLNNSTKEELLSLVEIA